MTKVLIVGAGLMGGGLAQVFASRSHDVRVFDPCPEARTELRRRVTDICQLLAVPDCAASLNVCDSLAQAAVGIEFAIEAVPERVPLKRAVFNELEQHAPCTAILASNTSAIPIKEITADIKAKGRTLGCHFWNPPHLIPLVEVVQADATDAGTIDQVMVWLREVGMTPVHVRRDIPGFIGNRLQHALKREAIALVANGICDAETVDTVTKLGFGARLGVIRPLEQSDMLGLGLTLDIHRALIADLDVTPGPHPYLSAKVEAGETGMRVGKGFRDWTPETGQAVRDRLDNFLADAAKRRREGEAS